MSNKLYVGGLSYSTTQQDLENLFSEQGTVVSAVVITERDSGRSKGFGFVEMSSSAEASHAINSLDGTSFDGRDIMVNEAKERATRRVANSNW